MEFVLIQIINNLNNLFKLDLITEKLHKDDETI